MKTISDGWEKSYQHLADISPKNFKEDHVIKHTITGMGKVYTKEMKKDRYNYFKQWVEPYINEKEWKNIEGTMWKYMYYSYHISSLLENLTFSPKVLEIGPGFGGLARILFSFLEVETYVVVEHPIMMKFFRYFNNDKEVYHIMPEDIEYLNNTKFDILISTLCLTEVPMEFRDKVLNLLKNVNSCFIINVDDPPGLIEQMRSKIEQAGMVCSISPYLKYGAKIVKGLRDE